MKKTLLFLTLLIFACSLTAFAQNISNEYLFLEGKADEEDHLEFFLWIFGVEAAGSGYTVTETKEEAAYTFKFDITPNMYEDEEGILHPAPDYDSQFVARISLVNNSNDEEILFFDFFYTNLYELYEFSQIIFHRATVYIPPEYYITAIDRSWQNKVFYFRGSIDYPIVFYALQPTDLFGGLSVFNLGPGGQPSNLIPLDHKIMPQPGVTFGLEFQLFDFMSFEFNLQANLGDPKTYLFINLAVGVEAKINIKTPHLVLQPYGAYYVPLNVSPVFRDFPPFSAGGGIQASVMGFNDGVFFVNVNFLYSLGDVFMHNPYDPLSPFPEVIHYNRFVFGIGFGYKFGFLDRNITSVR